MKKKNIKNLIKFLILAELTASYFNIDAMIWPTGLPKDLQREVHEAQELHEAETRKRKQAQGVATEEKRVARATTQTKNPSLFGRFKTGLQAKWKSLTNRLSQPEEVKKLMSQELTDMNNTANQIIRPIIKTSIGKTQGELTAALEHFNAYLTTPIQKKYRVQAIGLVNQFSIAFENLVNNIKIQATKNLVQRGKELLQEMAVEARLQEEN